MDGDFMSNMPRYVLKEKRLSKTKTVIIFRRNYMDVSNFNLENEIWTYEESFVHHGVKCVFKLIIHSKDICDMYNVNFKSMKIKGPRNSFGVFIRLPRQKLPIKAHGTLGCAEYYLYCVGRKLAYDNGKGINSNRNKDSLVRVSRRGTTTPIEVPNSVSWSAAHPFQGGGFTPK